MAFRIETAARGRFTVFILSGRIEKQAIGELRSLFECQTDYRDVIHFGWKEKKIESGIDAAMTRLSFSQSEIQMRGTYK
jgi:hypothetical protein